MVGGGNGGGTEAAAGAHNNQPTNGSNMAAETLFAVVAAATAAAVAVAVAVALSASSSSLQCAPPAPRAGFLDNDGWVKVDVQNITFTKVIF